MFYKKSFIPGQPGLKSQGTSQRQTEKLLLKAGEQWWGLLPWPKLFYMGLDNPAV